MRTFLGYLFCICTLIIFIISVNGFSKELQQFQPPQDYIKDKIDLHNTVLPQMSYITSANHQTISQIANEEKELI